jgi:hypothetical protein
MPGTEVFEYALIRVVPRVERGECLNTGVILYCKNHRYLAVRYVVDRPRLGGLSASLDLDEVERYLQVWDWICQGDPRGGPIAQLDLSARFRWLTAPRSTIIQPSPVHPGRCSDPAGKLAALFADFVLGE